MAEEQYAALRLARSRGIGPVTYANLVRKFGSATAALGALPDFIAEKRAGHRISIAQERDIDLELRGLEKLSASLLTLGGPDYPSALAATPDAPPVLAVLGDASLLHRDGVGIVGARNASAAGRRIAGELAADLGQAGLLITSGLARGIDAVAHQAALSTGTVAVLAGGVDNIYPPEHQGLYDEIVRQGAVVSEMRLGQTATARDFPKRNRIVSGLSKGVVVVEAADRSGTLVTARLALEQGRDVYAVPGSPLDPRAAGTNRLIRQGAALIRDAADVLTELGNARSDDLLGGAGFSEEMDAPAVSREALEREIRALLSPTPVHRDELLRATGANAGQLADILLDMVLSGEADELPGGMFAVSATADSRSST